MDKKDAEYLAERCKQLGKEHYDAGDKTGAGIFWELEAVYRKLAKS